MNLKVILNSLEVIKETINKRKCKSELSSHFKDNGETISDPQEIAKTMNEYFVNNLGPSLETTERFTSYLTATLILTPNF